MGQRSQTILEGDSIMNTIINIIFTALLIAFIAIATIHAFFSNEDQP